MNTNTYWNGMGMYAYTIDKLQKLIPPEGSVINPYKNKNLERFRKAANAYYRLYNDGDFNTGKAKMFGLSSCLSQYGRRNWSQELYDEVEVGMNRIIAAAALEQAIELR